MTWNSFSPGAWKIGTLKGGCRRSAVILGFAIFSSDISGFSIFLAEIPGFYKFFSEILGFENPFQYLGILYFASEISGFFTFPRYFGISKLSLHQYFIFQYKAHPYIWDGHNRREYGTDIKVKIICQ